MPISDGQDVCPCAGEVTGTAKASIANILYTVSPPLGEMPKKAPQYWSSDRKRNGGNAPACGGLPFFGHPSILTAIVKQFTSDTSSHTTPHLAHVRSSPALRCPLLTTL